MTESLSKCSCNRPHIFTYQTEYTKEKRVVCVTCGKPCEVAEKPEGKFATTPTEVKVKKRFHGIAKTPSPTPSGRLLSELEINKQLRKLYPSVEIMTFASRVAQVQQSLTAEEKDNIIHELKVTLYNDTQEIAELKADIKKAITHRQDVIENAYTRGFEDGQGKLQSSHQAKIEELFQEIEKIINFGDDWYGMEWENIKSKYLQGK